MKNRNKTTKFPVARIKKIMQKDEEVGKVAQATPVVISKALELFLAYIVNKTHDVTSERGSRKVEAYHLKHAVETNEMLDFLKELVEGVPDPSQGGTIDLEAEAESKRKRGKTKRAKDKDTNALPSTSALPSDTEAAAASAPAPKRSRKSKKAEAAPPAPEDEDYDAEATAAEPAPKKQKRARKAPVKEKKTKVKGNATEKIVAAPPPSSSAMAALPSLAGPSLSMASTPTLERDDPMDGTSRRGAVDEDMDDYDDDARRGEMSGSGGEERPGNGAVESEDEDDWGGRR